MTKFVPIFPLSIIVFPGEELNLHIFEPKYIQLVNDCLKKEEKIFGINTVIDHKIQELGTIVTIEKVVKQYDNGEMDIKTRGTQVFRTLEHIHDIPDKIYKGAIVHFIENIDNGKSHMMHQVLTATRLLHQTLQVYKDFKKKDEELNSFDIAHHVGLTPEQEYVLLGYREEIHRQEFLRRHLKKTTPLLSQIESIKERVKMNGHFRWLK